MSKTLQLTAVSLDDRFWSKVRKGAGDQCWLWTSEVNVQWGYGYFWYARRPRRAHILAYIAVNGPVPQGQEVLHTCDVRACVRPSHLYAGTRSRNMRDMVERGRRVVGDQRGELGSATKLAAVQVLEIRDRVARGEPQVGLAKEFAVSKMTISNIINYKSWSHI